MNDASHQIRFGQVALALGFLDARQYGEALYRLGRDGVDGSLRRLLLRLGWLTREQADRVDAKLDGDHVTELLTAEHYDTAEELGRGSFGRVLRARDRWLGRQVAIKTLHPHLAENDEAVGRFLLEAQVAGQLTHPNIVPVYEIGTLPGGSLYYAMKEVGGASLHEVLTAQRDGDAETQARYPLARLVRVLHRAAQAVDYAHAQGVVHRDIKPHNVMIGPFGEVYVLDWGSAKLLDETEVTDGDLDDAMLGVTASSVHTRAGKVKGTPAYMAPEQARAASDEVGPLTDVYALGAVLYEILCLSPPFHGQRLDQVLEEVIHSPPPPPRARASGRVVPPELEELSLRCLAKDPGQRPETVRAFRRHLEDFLDGTRRRDQAAHSLREAEVALERFEDLSAQVDELAREARRALRRVAPWAPVEQKRHAWHLDRQHRDRLREREEAFNLALSGYQRALAYDPDDGGARQAVANLYWRKFEEAEARGDEEATEFFRTQVLLFDDGAFRQQLGGMSGLSVDSDPPGAAATLYRCEEQDRLLVPSIPRKLGQTPTTSVKLAQGFYVLKLELDGYVDARLSLFSNRPGSRRYRVRMRRPEEVGEGYVLVPGGRFLQGGDPRVPESWPRTPVYVPDFAIARHPVTFGEYLEFLEELSASSGRDALARAPRTDPRGRRLVRWDDERGMVTLAFPEDRMEQSLRWPVFSVTFDDAVAYAEWRSAREGRELRLPSEVEWEKAARGVDGRLYPWGDVFEPTYCNCRTSREDSVSIEPVGSYPNDVSIYGVADLAGGVMEWCADEVPGHPHIRRVRGGAWNREGRDCSLVEGRSMPRWTTGTAIGFRLLAPLLGSGGISLSSLPEAAPVE